MTTTTTKRGFAAMDPEKRREYARQGGRAVHAMGRGHVFTSDEASAAGRKGGIESGRRKAEARRAAAAEGASS